MKRRTKIRKVLGLSAVILMSIVGAAFLSIGVFVGIAVLKAETQAGFNSRSLTTLNAQTSFYSADDKLISESGINGRPRVNLSDLPAHVIDAFVSVEDKNFYLHKGLNPRRILAAMYKNIASGNTVEGASTISQQLVKNRFLSNEKTYERKLMEAYLAIKLERACSKDEILECYLNTIYFGNGAYGIEQASNVFFNKPAGSLSLSEGATLAAVIKSPKLYSPVSRPEQCVSRRNLVLWEMLQDGKITPQEYKTAADSELKTSHGFSGNYAEAYFRLVMAEAEELLSLSEHEIACGRLKIYTYMDTAEQKLVSDSIKAYPDYESAAILLNSTGMISAVSQTRNTDLYRIKRPGGSIVKPFLVYAPAFEHGILSPATPVLDEPVSFSDYSPENIGGKYLGWTNVRKSIADSLNIPAVKTLEYVGIEKAKNLSSKLGIEFAADDNHLALALGAMKHGVNPIAVTGAYSAFANGGLYTKPTTIRKIETENGKVMYRHNCRPVRAFESDTAYLITDTLRDSVRRGTARRLRDLGIDIASKTGTAGAPGSHSNTDAWNVGYTTGHTLCVWFGNSSGKPELNLLQSENGGTIGANLSRTILKSLYARNKPAGFIMPDTVENLRLNRIDYENQKLFLAAEDTPERYTLTDVFSKRYAPTKVSDTNYLPETAQEHGLPPAPLELPAYDLPNDTYEHDYEFVAPLKRITSQWFNQIII
ncbi:MAG: transglycosylase domain-containing protein [Firmicutes bacterium]|nr:transglycosylase domain-containing protein [Bacillota bacterium]